MKVPLLDLRPQYESLRAEIEKSALEVLESQGYVLGPRVAAFERQVADFSGVGEAVGCSSGTDAQIVALMGLGYGCGDAVITTPYTFFATIGCLVRLGIEPVLADIDPVTFNLSAGTVRAAISEQCVANSDGGLRTRTGSRVRAIMPVHLFGQCAPMEALAEIATEHHLDLIEDGAQALGAEMPWRGSSARAGSVGVAAFYSFYPTKNLGACGDAGMAVCHDPEIAARMRAIRNHGMTERYHHPMLGGNFRLDALQAAILAIKLPHLDKWSEGRRRNAALYRTAFAGLPGSENVILPEEVWAGSGAVHHHIYNQYVIRSPRRDALRAFLTEEGIGTEIYYPVPLHRQECFRTASWASGAYPEAERAAAESLALPIYPELSPEQISHVAERVCAFHAKAM